jgi:hypothetical protein
MPEQVMKYLSLPLDRNSQVEAIGFLWFGNFREDFPHAGKLSQLIASRSDLKMQMLIFPAPFAVALEAVKLVNAHRSRNLETVQSLNKLIAMDEP